MSSETTIINDSKTYKDFIYQLREKVALRGHLTPHIKQLLEYLDTAFPVFSEQALASIGQQAVLLTQDKETPLQSLCLLGNLLKGFRFRPEELETIGTNTIRFLNDVYSQELPQDERSIDTRIAGWTILEEIVPQAQERLKKDIFSLSSRVGQLGEEDDYVRIIALTLGFNLDH